MINRREKYIGLEYIRAIAALMVVYFHTTLQIEHILTNMSSIWPIVGKSGVDIFFILSGFVMWVSTSHTKITTIQFYIKRIIRIVPLYWSTTILTGVIALLVPHLLHSTIFEFHHFIASLVFIPWPNPASTNASDLMTPIMVVGWTLNFEMFFYAIFGIVLMFARKWRFPLMVGAMMVVFIADELFAGKSDVLDFYGSSKIFEFVMGIGMAVAIENRYRLHSIPAIAALIVGFSTLLYIESLSTGLPRLLQSGVPAFLIVFGMTSLELNNRMIELKFLKLIGSASYSIYLTHIFAIAFAREFALVIGWSVYSALSQASFIIFCLILAIGLGLCVHLYFEKPITKFLQKQSRLNARKDASVAPPAAA